MPFDYFKLLFIEQAGYALPSETTAHEGGFQEEVIRSALIPADCRGPYDDMLPHGDQQPAFHFMA